MPPTAHASLGWGFCLICPAAARNLKDALQNPDPGKRHGGRSFLPAGLSGCTWWGPWHGPGRSPRQRLHPLTLDLDVVLCLDSGLGEALV